MSSKSVSNCTYNWQIGFPHHSYPILFITFMISDLIGFHSVLSPLQNTLTTNFFFIFCFNNGLWIYFYSKGVETENTSSCFSKRQWTIIQWQCSNHGMFESSCESYFLCVWESLHPDTFVGLLLALYWYSLGTIFICKKHLKSLWKFKSFQYIVFTYFFKWFLKLTCQKKMNICIGSRVLAADCKSRLQSL